MTRPNRIAQRLSPTARWLGAVVVRAGTLVAFGGEVVALLATLTWASPSAGFGGLLGLSYGVWFRLSEWCARLALGCLVVGWLVVRWDRAAGDDSRIYQHRRLACLNVLAFLLACVVPAYAAI